MTLPAQPISPTALALSSLLVVTAGAVSLALRLSLERSLALAATRTIVQLLAVGAVLSWVFRLDDPRLLGLVMLLMIGAASFAAVGRASRTFKGALGGAFVTLVLTGSLTTFTVTGLIIGVDPWYRAQYVIPLLGMVLGNALTGISLCLDSFLESLDDGADEIEAALALGAHRWEAARGAFAKAVRRGMIPILNSMMVVGIVSLPGMMTGQILQGGDPSEAVKYQIVVMFMIAAATSLGCMLMAAIVYRRMFNERHQLERAVLRRE